MSANLTAHARVRMQQRGIPAAAVEALLDYGKAARSRLAAYEPIAARTADRLVRTYAIVGSDGAVITVGARYRRMPRD